MDEFNQNAFAEKREEQPRAGPTEDRDPQSAAAEVGRAEPSAPERSEGERRGARPTSESFPDAGLDLSDSVDSEVEASLSKRREFHSRLSGRGPVKGRRLVKKSTEPVPAMTAEQRILLLDTWQRSGLPAGDFAPLVGVSKHTLYAWKKRFEISGPAGLLDQPRGKPPGSRVHELTKRTILMLKKSNPEWGCQRISDMLLRGPALPASASAVARVLHEAGYQLEQAPTRGHPDKVRSFERARPNQVSRTEFWSHL
ncbi:helix-turn-helix domain-containing protein [Telmatocola sphagniphila]|uniref:Helix-turn-helix domain-containing protein n=1 Tax=Telmatocola sphagniphila TaxID=1123043 RepID=A0A8E6ETP3_9BACT|nr:helix-turn-helix domain-containing protein [Telmatocola sphagniphila]QVL30217.1 helix-turn-helix domain-containing protein [Telmatocola sphagniphila]